MKNKKTSAVRSSGFTLVETVLALLAIGIGLVGLFGLGRLAMESSRETENDRRCAMMADAIFETLRTVNTVYINEARTNAWNESDPAYHWRRLWTQEVKLWNQNPEVPSQPPPALWDTEGRLLFPHVAGMSTNAIPLIYLINETDFVPNDAQDYILASDEFCRAYDHNAISLANWNPLYHLSITDVGDNIYYSPITGTYNAKKVMLLIYPDGKTGASDPRVFTTILTNPGGMQ